MENYVDDIIVWEHYNVQLYLQIEKYVDFDGVTMSRIRVVFPGRNVDIANLKNNVCII